MLGVLPDNFRDEFVIAGPGAAVGINLIYPQVKGQRGYMEAMVRLRDDQRAMYRGNRGKVMPYLTLHDIEFNACELAKYVKIMHGTGKKRKYKYGGSSR